MEHVWRLSSQQRSTIKKKKKKQHFIYTRKQGRDNGHLFTGGTVGVTFGAPLARLQDPRTVTCRTHDASNTKCTGANGSFLPQFIRLCVSVTEPVYNHIMLLVIF